MKVTKRDAVIIRAALMAVLDDDTDEFEDLSENDLDRATDLIEELSSEFSLDDFEDDEEESSEEEE